MTEDNKSRPATVCNQKADSTVSRRAVLRGATLTAGGAAILAAGLSAQPAEAKMAETAAGYQASAKDGKSCSTCSLFEAPSSCKLVDGTISPNGYCRFYIKKS